MKKIPFFFLLISFLVINAQAQTKTPLEIFNGFWELALKNDFESAQKQIDSIFFGEKNMEILKKDFDYISKNEFGKLEPIKEDIKVGKTDFIFKSKVKNGHFAYIKVLLVKTFRGYEIVRFSLMVVPPATENELTSSRYTLFSERVQPKSVEVGPLKSYNPNENPIKFLGIIPKNN